MTELASKDVPFEGKTLKDIEHTFAYFDAGEIILLERIKQEAIKWVKRFSNYERIPWMKFFNITEEDLK